MRRILWLVLLGLWSLPAVAAPVVTGRGTQEDPWRLPADLDTLPRAQSVWEVALDDQPEVKVLAGWLHVLTPGPDGRRLRALDPATGQAVWSRPAPGGRLVLAQADVLLVDAMGRWQAFAPADGRLLWSAPSRPRAVPWQGRLVVPTGRRGHVELRSATTGAVLWRGKVAPGAPGHLGPANDARFEMMEGDSDPQALLLRGDMTLGLGVDRDGRVVTLPCAPPPGKPATGGTPLLVGPDRLARIPDAGPLPRNDGMMIHLARSDGGVAMTESLPPGSRPVLWRLDPGAPGPLAAILLGEREGQLVAVRKDVAVWRHKARLTGFRVAAPWLPSRRQAVALERDVSLWLDLAAGRSDRADADCRAVDLDETAAGQRLSRLPADDLGPTLVRRLADATLQDLLQWAPWACSGTGSQRELRAWTQRWAAVTPPLGSDEWAPFLQAGQRCHALLGDGRWWQGVAARTQRQPWTQASLGSRAAVVDVAVDPSSEDQARTWATSIARAFRRALPTDRAATPMRHSWSAFLATVGRWLAPWPGLPALWAELDAALLERGPAVICPRLGPDEPCLVEPPDGAWQAGDSPWAVAMVGAPADPQHLWAFRWQDGVWHGPWFVGPPPTDMDGDTPTDWTRLAEPLDDGVHLSWRQKTEDEPCTGPDEKEPTVYLPEPVTWATLEVDTDGDGWTDRLERWLGTDPRRADTDGDGVPDVRDAAPTCPRRPAEARTVAVGTILRLRTLPWPLRLDAGEPCVDVPTAGGPLLPTADDGLQRLATQGPRGGAAGTWTVILELKGMVGRFAMDVAATPSGWLAASWQPNEVMRRYGKWLLAAAGSEGR